MLLANKLNKLRTIALALVFLGVLVMYLGFVWPKVMIFFFILGVIVMFSSFGIYLWAGILTTQATKVQCPECGKVTKILGLTDQCMYCSTTLSLDPKHAPDKKTAQKHTKGHIDKANKHNDKNESK